MRIRSVAIGPTLRSTVRVCLYVYTYVFLEWLFLATKPSFLGAWTVLEQFKSVLIGAIPFLLAALALHALFCLMAWTLSAFTRAPGRKDMLFRVVPALIATATVLILVDNFTYTVFGWGIVKTTVYTAPIYWILAILVCVLLVRRKATPSLSRSTLAAVLVAASGVALLWSFHGADRVIHNNYARSGSDTPLPNIIIFGADGVSAKFMSAYGYPRKTTPNLDAYMGQALVADNAFTNSGWTTGSLTSMMTGKYSSSTKVLYPPYTLQGMDAYENLPRILHELGYRNLQESVRYYADGPDLNWKDSFGSANGRKIEFSQGGSASLALQNASLFSKNLYERLGDRIKQLLFIEPMVDTYAMVADAGDASSDGASSDFAKVYGISDQARMDRVADFITQTKQPFFIHIHLMGTHCCSYRPEQKHFSARKFDDKKTLKAAQLDDAILDSDRYFGQMMNLLKHRKLLQNTLIIYTSDHNDHWDFRSQVPMVFLFPRGEHQGHLTNTTQLLDVAPTVLDYLKVPIPDWMEGKSLLRGDLERDRPVFAIFRLDKSHFKTKQKDTLARVAQMGPPTYGVNKAGLVVCQRWYIMQLNNGNISNGDIDTYRDKCPADQLPTDDVARAMMSQHLHDRGFEF